MSAMATINPKKYGALLVATLPVAIETPEEHSRMLGAISRLMEMGEDNLSIEEERLLRMMVLLVENYEDKTSPMPEASPVDILALLMEQHGLRQAHLLDVFGSRGVVSDACNGRRAISKAQAKKLAARFNVSADLFI